MQWRFGIMGTQHKPKISYCCRELSEKEGRRCRSIGSSGFDIPYLLFLLVYNKGDVIKDSLIF